MVTGLALGGLIGALGVVGVLVALVWYLVRWARTASAKEPEALRTLRKSDARIAGLERAVQTRDRALKRVLDDAERARRALRTVERQRDEAVEDLVALGDSNGIAAGIRRELERMRALSEELSELPRADTAPTTDDRDGG